MEMEDHISWNILDAYFREHIYPFTKHHLDSFKQFIKVNIPNTIANYNPITMIKFGESENDEAVKVEVYIGGLGDKLRIYVDRPTSFDEDGKSILLTPNETRLRNITYATKLYTDIDIVYSKDGEKYKTVEFKHILLGVIPLMLHSDQCILHGQGSKVIRGLSECPMDGGGYFIVDGKEKVIVSQERITTNTLFVEKVNDPDIFYRATLRSTGSSGESALIPKVLQIIVVNPKPKLSDVKGESDDIEEAGYKTIRGGIFVSVQGFNSIFPLTTLFRAIGFETDKSIVEAICGSDITNDNLTLKEYMNYIRPSIVHGNSIKMKNSEGHTIFLKTMADAHLNLKPRTYFKSIQQVKSILTLDFLPNIEGGLREKGIYLGYLVRQVINTIIGIRTESDRDSYEFKRVDISGYLLSQLFQETYSKFRKHIRNELDKYYKFGHIETTGKLEELVTKSNINRIFTPVFITDTFTRSLKGMWGQVTDDPEQGLVQDLSRISYIGFLSHLRRVNIPLDRSIKIRSPHTLHANQWGRFCPFETPDGASVGYLKNLAILTQISSGTAASTLYPLLDELGVHLLKNVAIFHITNNVLLFINGSLYGITDKPDLVVRTIRLYRRNGLINPFISVAWNIKLKEIHIHTEAGRPMRPVLIVENGKIIAESFNSRKWYDMLYGSFVSDSYKNENAYYDDRLLSDITNERSIEEALKLLENSQGCIEYLDVEEENTCLIAIDKKDIGGYHTHLEINPITLFSVVTQLVPLLNHNQSPRVVFHGAQSKQAIGIYATNFTKRFDTMGYIQHYPQKRLITTRGSHYNGANLMPNGTNCIVSIMTHTGFNQEDSVMINKGSIDRGLYHLTAYKTLTAIEKTLSQNDRLVFANPIEWRKSGKVIQNVKHADYTLLDKNGFIKEGSYIPAGQMVVIVGMIHIHQSVKIVNKGVLTDKEVVETYTDVSLVTDVHHYGHIDKVFVGNQIPGIDRADVSRVCKVRFRKIRRPEPGDKNCSSHGQKGVIGLIIPEVDMPFTKDGIRPDIIINPHAIPSRMTIGHLIETVFAKLCCMDGVIGDGTVFLPFDKSAMFDSLEKYGYEKYGNEVLYNSRTGHQLDTEIFIGPIYYYRLKHMVTDKVHARDKGPKSQLTRQPTSGRSKHGGLRLGEMERDVVLSYGISQFIKEGWMERSDKFKWAVCRYCGILSLYGPSINECKKCNRQDIVLIETPYAFKLLIQELECLGLQMRLSPDEAPIEYEDSEASSSDSEESLPGIIESSTSESEEEEEEKSESEEEVSESEEEVSESEEEVSEKSTLESEMSGGENTEPVLINELIDDNLDVNLPVLSGGTAGNSPLTETGATLSENVATSAQSTNPLTEIVDPVSQNVATETISQNVATQDGGNTKIINIDMGSSKLPEPKSSGDGDEENAEDMDFFA